MSLSPRYLLLVCIAFSTGCAVTSSPPVNAPPPELSAEARSAYLDITVKREELLGVGAASEPFERQVRFINSAKKRGDSAEVIALAERAERRANVLLNVAYRDQARQEIEKLKGLTNLDRVAYEAIRSARNLFEAGHSVAALNAALEAQAAMSENKMIWMVKKGDTLGGIAGSDDVYGNWRWWPIIYKDNQHNMRSPNSMPLGLELTIRLNPTSDEVTEAVSYGLRTAQVKAKLMSMARKKVRAAAYM